MRDPDQLIAEHVRERGLVDPHDLEESLRILDVRADIGEASSLDALLFERGLLDADEVRTLQKRLSQRSVFCPECATRHELYERKPGKRVRCSECRLKFTVPGQDEHDPFALLERGPRPELEQGLFAKLLSLLVLVGVGACFVLATLGSWGSAFGYAALGGGVLCVCGAAPLVKRQRFLAAAGGGLALFTALVVFSAASTSPGEPGLSLLGVGAHRLVPALVIVHLLLLSGLALPFLREVESSALYLALCVPLCYGGLFFASRCFPGVEVTALLSDPSGALSVLPWYLHPGVVTLLVVFPLAGLVVVGAGVVRIARREPGTLLRHGGLVLGLALLAAFGLTVGTLRGEIPLGEARRSSLEQALGGRQAAWLERAETPRGSTAAAVTSAD
jgi:hypothetical protein